MNWPIDRGQNFKGIYDFANDQIVCYAQGHGHHVHNFPIIDGLTVMPPGLIWVTPMKISLTRLSWFKVRAIAMSKRTLNLPR